MFGFQIFDEQGKPFYDENILKAEIVTYTEKWNEYKQLYDKVPIQYNHEKCSEVFHPNDEKWAKRFEIDWSYLEATGFSDYNCAADLRNNFIGGNRFSETFRYTQLELSVCDPERNPQCNTNSSFVEETINGLHIQFSYLDTYFDGENL